jgi:hypothetical protein
MQRRERQREKEGENPQGGSPNPGGFVQTGACGFKQPFRRRPGRPFFVNMQTNLLLSSAGGAGIAVNSKTKQETFMKMISLGKK